MRSFALAIAALLLLTSCADDPGPIEPTTSPSLKPTATAPALPDDASTESPDAAIAFVKHWIDVFNFAVNTGAVEPFNALNRSTCDGCKSYEDQIRESNKDSAEVRNFRWVGGKSTLREDRTFEATIRASDYEVRDSASEEWSKVRGSTFKLGFQLKWGDGQWQVHELYVPDPK